MPHNVIEHLNSIAASEPQQTPPDLEFSLGQLAIEDLDQSPELPHPSMDESSATDLLAPLDLTSDVQDTGNSSMQPPTAVIAADEINPTSQVITDHFSSANDTASAHRGDSDARQLHIPPSSLESTSTPEINDEPILEHVPQNIWRLEPSADSSTPSSTSDSTYNLRNNRAYGHLDGDWRHRGQNFKDLEHRDYGLHITMNKASKTYGDRAQVALDNEVHNMETYKAFEPTHYHSLTALQRKKLLRTSSFVKEKFLSTGEFDKLRARLVMGGHEQDRSLYPDTSSPTISTDALLMISCIAAHERRKVVTADIPSAYLNTPQPEASEIFGILDKRVAEAFCRLYPRYKPFIRHDGTLIVKLRKAVYGCIESGKLWFRHISDTLKELGFTPNPVQPCVFNKTTDEVQITIGLYVDDLKITCIDQQAIETLIDQLSSKYGPLKVTRGTKHSYLGMTFDYSVDGQARVSMEGYIRDLVRVAGVTNKSSTPATNQLFCIDNKSKLLDDKMKAVFHSLTAKALFPAKRVRPECLLSTIFLTTRVQCPTEQDLVKLRRVISYLNAEPELGIILRADNLNQIVVYIDASYGIHQDFKSHTGGITTFGNGCGPIHAKSTKQKLMSKSSTEAELIGHSDYAPQGIATRDFMAGQGYEMKPVDIRQDNLSTIALVRKGYPTSEHTRHINIRFFFLKDLLDRGEIKITHTPAKDMIADILTKPLQGELFRRLRDLLLNGTSNH
jgi:hypothetical protein